MDYSGSSSFECSFRVHGFPTLSRLAYQPKGKSANSARLGSRSIGWCKQEMTGPPPDDILSPKNCHAPSSASCETYVAGSVPSCTVLDRKTRAWGSFGNFQLNKLLFGSAEAQKSFSTFVMGASGCISGCSNALSNPSSLREPILQIRIHSLKYREIVTIVVPLCPPHKMCDPLQANGTELTIHLPD